MSDSSEDEDLSKFKDVVDNSFVTTMKADNISHRGLKPPGSQKSQRYLEEASHYNDVKVPEEMAQRIGAKLAAVIERNIQFVDVEPQHKSVKKNQHKGGVKLFRESAELLSWKEEEDTYTAGHNQESKKMKIKRRVIDNEDVVNESDKVKAATVEPDFVISKDETKWWKTRRKEKGVERV